MEQACVFDFLEDCRLRGERSVLVTVCAVEGSSMRNPGTVMGVAADGSFAGSLSGGCIEQAVVAEALDALKADAPRMVRFGAGSPYLDIKLPCGGGLDLHFQPLQESFLSADCVASIRGREPFAIRISEERAEHIGRWRPASFDPETGHTTFGHWPMPKLQIIGHGAGVAALAQLARTHGCALRVLTPDSAIIKELGKHAIHGLLLDRTSQTDLLLSDPWTATIFLFHDHDWEIELMAHALETGERVTRKSWKDAWRHSSPTLAVANFPALFFISAGFEWMTVDQASMLSQITAIALLSILGTRVGWVIDQRVIPAILGGIFFGSIGLALGVLKFLIH